MKSASIIITEKCNFNCPHCSINAKTNSKELMTCKDITKIIKKLCKEGCKKIDLSGGEPLLRKDLNKIIKETKKLNIKTKILTNGYLLNKKKIMEIKSLGVNGIAISLDSLDYETQKITRPISKKAHKKIINNIKLTKNSGIKTKINIVAYKSSLKHLRELIIHAVSLGVDEIRICYLLPVGRGKTFNKKEIITPKEWIKYVNEKLKDIDTKKTELYVGSLIIPKKSRTKSIKCDCLINNNENIEIYSKKNTSACPLLKNSRKKSFMGCKKLLEKEFGKNYIPKRYKFSCPIRKYLIKELLM